MPVPARVQLFAEAMSGLDEFCDVVPAFFSPIFFTSTGTEREWNIHRSGFRGVGRADVTRPVPRIA